MVEVVIEEMYGSDWNRPKRLQTSRGHRHWAKERDERRRFSKRTEKCAQKKLARADVVRDVRFL